MKTRRPTSEEIAELVAFLPRLYAKGFSPIKKRAGGTENRQGGSTMPWPEYEKVVIEFFQIAAKECWTDYNYDPKKAAQMMKNDDVIKNANLEQIKTMLTFCVRGERFCDGHWAAIIEKGYIRKLLQRLAELEPMNNDH